MTEELDPQPTMFGTSATDPIVAPDGSTEYSRAVLWIMQRAARFAFGAQLMTTLLGDPIANANLRAGYQPLVDWKNDQMMVVSDLSDEMEGEPMGNWGANN